jgi:hypothetical protein
MAPVITNPNPNLHTIRLRVISNQLQLDGRNFLPIQIDRLTLN